MMLKIDDTYLEELATLFADQVVNKLNNLELKSDDTYKQYMNKKEASQYVGVSVNSFDKLVKSGLKSIVISDGTAIRFSKKSIDDFMQKNEL